MITNNRIIHAAQYQSKNDENFRKTLTGLRVKAEISCEQTDSACTVTKFTEKVRIYPGSINYNLLKTCILVAMLFANVLGVIILIIEVSRNIGDHLGEKYKKRRTLSQMSTLLSNS